MSDLKTGEVVFRNDGPAALAKTATEKLHEELTALLENKTLDVGQSSRAVELVETVFANNVHSGRYFHQMVEAKHEAFLAETNG